MKKLLAVGSWLLAAMVAQGAMNVVTNQLGEIGNDEYVVTSITGAAIETNEVNALIVDYDMTNLTVRFNGKLDLPPDLAPSNWIPVSVGHDREAVWMPNMGGGGGSLGSVNYITDTDGKCYPVYATKTAEGTVIQVIGQIPIEPMKKTVEQEEFRAVTKEQMLYTNQLAETAQRIAADNDLQTQINAISTLGRFVSTWNAKTGLPSTNPKVNPFPYEPGDYYIVGAADETLAPTNFIPFGEEYWRGIASTNVAEDAVYVNDVYRYTNDKTWVHVTMKGASVLWSQIVGNPLDNTNLVLATHYITTNTVTKKYVESLGIESGVQTNEYGFIKDAKILASQVVEVPGMCFTAVGTNVTVTMTATGATAPDIYLQYTRDGMNWHTFVSNRVASVVTLTNVGDRVWLRAGWNNDAFHENDTNGKYWKFVLQNEVASSGSIEYLRRQDGTVDTLTDKCYSYLFMDCKTLKTPPELPAMQLAERCYYGMFWECNAMEQAPELPATTLSENCYAYMFNRCYNIRRPPLLPANTLAKGCYSYMFWSCYNLSEAPALPAKNLAVLCYNGMFENCASIIAAPRLAATKLEASCYSGMFGGSGIVNPPEIAATQLADSCYASMFNACNSLTVAPKLPATELSQNCYDSMFMDCGALIVAPELPATVLTNRCYQYMFSGCDSLKEPPKLPATTLAQSCYYAMFIKCDGLETVPKLEATNLDVYCYGRMFENCKSLKELPELPATVLPMYCYDRMFNKCESVMLSTTNGGIYATPYRIPSSGDASSVGYNALDRMFNLTGGTFAGTPSANTTYYGAFGVVPYYTKTEIDSTSVTNGGARALTLSLSSVKIDKPTASVPAGYVATKGANSNEVEWAMVPATNIVGYLGYIRDVSNNAYRVIAETNPEGSVVAAIEQTTTPMPIITIEEERDRATNAELQVAIAATNYTDSATNALSLALIPRIDDATNRVVAMIADEAALRASGDTALSASIANEATLREAVDSDLDTKITVEKSRAEGQEALLNIAITNEAALRASSDAVLQTNIGIETTRATVNEAALGRRIDALVDGTNTVAQMVRSEKTRAEAAEATLVPKSEKGVANGVATLDGTGKVPVAQIPTIAVEWGNIGGTLDNQTDLTNRFATKQDKLPEATKDYYLHANFLDGHLEWKGIEGGDISNYNALAYKPIINGNVLTGGVNLASADLGLMSNLVFTAAENGKVLGVNDTKLAWVTGGGGGGGVDTNTVQYIIDDNIATNHLVGFELFEEIMTEVGDDLSSLSHDKRDYFDLEVKAHFLDQYMPVRKETQEISMHDVVFQKEATYYTIYCYTGEFVGTHICTTDLDGKLTLIYPNITLGYMIPPIGTKVLELEDNIALVSKTQTNLVFTAAENGKVLGVTNNALAWVTGGSGGGGDKPYLPLDGSTNMTGRIKFDMYDAGMNVVGNTNRIVVCAGDDWEKGASFELYGNGAVEKGQSRPGDFFIIAHGPGTQHSLLRGRADGTLTWGTETSNYRVISAYGTGSSGNVLQSNGTRGYWTSPSWLPLAGGTMKGSIIHPTSEGTSAISGSSNTNNNAIAFGGTSYSDGASIWLCGKNKNSGAFGIDAYDGTTRKSLIGSSDGTLKWGSNYIVNVPETNTGWLDCTLNSTYVSQGWIKARRLNGVVYVFGQDLTFTSEFTGSKGMYQIATLPTGCGNNGSFEVRGLFTKDFGRNYYSNIWIGANANALIIFDNGTITAKSGRIFMTYPRAN